MKRLLLVTSILTICFFSRAQITWDGGGDGTSWSDAANWVGDIAPAATDNVLLDNSVVPGSYTVNLPSGTVTTTINTITITPSGTNNITLILPSTNNANPGFTVSGTGDALLLNNGAILRNSSGATAGTGINITNTFRINNGGRYIHNTGRGNAGIVSQLSTAAGTEDGIFEFDVPLGSYSPSLSNRTYGSLVLSAVANGGSATYIGSGTNPCTIRGNFTINTGVTFSISMSAAFIVQKNFTQNSSATFNLQSSTNNNIVSIAGNLDFSGTLTESSTGLPVLELNGTANQQISGTGSITNSITLRINNVTGATLNSPLTLPYNLELTDGKITTTSTNLLTMVDNATYTGGSTTSFIEGPMKKRGDDDFLFPVGKGGIFAPIGISGGSGAAATDEFTAEYIRSNPQAVHGACPANCVPGLDHISFVEYWTLDRNSGSASKQVSLTVHPLSFSKVLSSTYVSKWNGAQWTNEATTVSAGPVPCGAGMQCGIITTTSAITSFSDFTLATDLPYITNPLPVKLITFNARKVNSTTAHITWELADICLKETVFDIQRSADGRNFSSIATLPGSETGKQYFHLDPQLEKGITYYRLKILEPGAAIVYSRTVAIINDSRGLLITSVSPNPVQGTSYISISAAKAGLVQLELYNISSQRVMQYSAPVAEGNNTIPLNMQQLPHGIYQLQAIIGTDRSSFRVVK